MALLIRILQWCVLSSWFVFLSDAYRRQSLCVQRRYWTAPQLCWYTVLWTLSWFFHMTPLKKWGLFHLKSSIHPCLCIFIISSLKCVLSLVQVAVLIAVFILSLAVGLGLPKPFWKGLRRDTGYHEYFMYFFSVKKYIWIHKKRLVQEICILFDICSELWDS